MYTRITFPRTQYTSRISSSRINDERFASGWVSPYHLFTCLVPISIHLRDEGSDLPEHQTLHRSAHTLSDPIDLRRNKHPQEDQDQDCSPFGRTNIHHNKSCIHRKNRNIQSNRTARVPALEENSQVLRRDMVVGMVLVNKRKLCDLRAFVAFSVFELILLGIEPEEVA